MCFIIRDEMIHDDMLLSEVSSLMNGGSISGLFNAEEVATIVAEVVQRTKVEAPASHAELFATFFATARRNVNIVFCFSPLSTRFRCVSQRLVRDTAVPRLHRSVHVVVESQ